MTGRVIAIGDVHGCNSALSALINAVQPCPSDTIITLGDLIDRGPDSRRVLDRVMDLQVHCRLVPIMGDHEAMLLDALTDSTKIERWLRCGGTETLNSYGWKPGSSKQQLKDWIPGPHRDFLAGCRHYYETSKHIFMHAGFQPELPMKEQPMEALLWRALDPKSAAPHCSGKVAVVGHSPQRNGNVLDLGHLIGLDTNCVRGGWLTALEVGTGQIWQADSAGRLK